MDSNEQNINQLVEKLRALMVRHQEFSTEIKALRDEIYALQNKTTTSTAVQPVTPPTIAKEVLAPVVAKVPKEVLSKSIPKPAPKVKKSKTDFEKFIGENLINKIGIAITVIGVAIGAKYSIENELISPLTRIVLGYLSGLGLLGFGIKLKQKYENYSAVLVSGAISIMYLMTYMAYDFYGLFPQSFAFALMLIFTAFTVFAAIQYKRQVIAHIGLVGAYAVPFLLSNNSGNVSVLFAYMCIINIGILLISVRQYWKSLYYSAFFFTWAIFFGWVFNDYENTDFSFTFIFLTLFFAIFYATFLVYKLVKQEKFTVPDVILMLVNSFIFFGVGLSMLEGNEETNHLLGVFTVINAIIHAIVSGVIYKLKLADKKLLYLIAGLVMVFVTIAVPIQLDGNWVTFIWLAEAVLLYTLAKTKSIGLYEKLSYPILFLAIVSLLQDWGFGYNKYFYSQYITPVFNIHFLTSVFGIIALGVINYLHAKKEYPSALSEKSSLSRVIGFVLPAVFLAILYFSLYLEIDTYWSQLYQNTKITIPVEDGYDKMFTNYDLKNFGVISLINYSLIFFSILTFINIKKVKSVKLTNVSMLINTLTVIIFLTLGLYELSDLRTTYLVTDSSDYFNRSIFNLIIRYICYGFVAVTLFANAQNIKTNSKLKPAFELFLSATILWILCSELVHWLSIAQYDGTYKLGLSILSGTFALVLVSYGIWKQKQHLRIAAMVVFGATLIKLFAYDIIHLNTIAKTIVFVSLGVLLLIFSFLYNKFKTNIDETN